MPKILGSMLLGVMGGYCVMLMCLGLETLAWMGYCGRGGTRGGLSEAGLQNKDKNRVFDRFKLVVRCLLGGWAGFQYLDSLDWDVAQGNWWFIAPFCGVLLYHWHYEYRLHRGGDRAEPTAEKAGPLGNV